VFDGICVSVKIVTQFDYVLRHEYVFKLGLKTSSRVPIKVYCRNFQRGFRERTDNKFVASSKYGYEV